MGYKIIMEAGAGVLAKAQLEAQSKWSNDIERVSRWTKWLLIKLLLPQPPSVFYALCWPSKHHPINHLGLDKDGKKRKWTRKVKAPISENLKSGNSMKSPRVLVESWKWTKSKKIHPDGQWWWLEMIPHIVDANICSLSLSLITTDVIILAVVIWKVFVIDIVIVLVIVAAIDHSCDLGLPMEVTRATQRRWHISLYFCPLVHFYHDDDTLSWWWWIGRQRNRWNHIHKYYTVCNPEICEKHMRYVQYICMFGFY